LFNKYEETLTRLTSFLFVGCDGYDLTGGQNGMDPLLVELVVVVVVMVVMVVGSDVVNGDGSLLTPSLEDEGGVHTTSLLSRVLLYREMPVRTRNSFSCMPDSCNICLLPLLQTRLENRNMSS
jgi:hypothetical protein